MGKIAKFVFEAQEIRTAEKDGEVWFIAKDVCNVLDVGNSSQALSRLRQKDLGDIISNDITGRAQSMRVISEFGLYELVLSSKKENAKAFKYWICDEVIPAIRKTGSYGVKQMTTAEMILAQAKQLVEQERKILALEKEQEKQGQLLADLRDGADHYAITAYHKVFLKKTISNEGARKDGIRLGRVCRAHGIQIGRSPHPIWGTVNTYPKAILDDYYKSN